MDNEELKTLIEIISRKLTKEFLFMTADNPAIAITLALRVAQNIAKDAPEEIQPRIFELFDVTQKALVDHWNKTNA